MCNMLIIIIAHNQTESDFTRYNYYYQCYLLLLFIITLYLSTLKLSINSSSNRVIITFNIIHIEDL